MSTERAGLIELVESQAGVYITINEILRQMEALTVGIIISNTLTAPPVSPAAGSVYIVASPATGVWSGYDKYFAHWYSGSWHFYPPISGMTAWVQSTPWRYDGANWGVVIPNFEWGMVVGGELSIPLYTVASAPNPATRYGKIIGVTNGNSGALCLAMSDGGAWRRIPLGATISAT